MKKNKLHNILSFFGVLLVVLTLCTISVSADTISSSENIKACADAIKDEYYNAISQSDEEISQEYLKNNYEANITYNNIIDYIKANNDELRDHFSGAFVNDEGYLVIALCCDSENCERKIKNDLSCSEVLFEEGSGSYYYGQEELNSINEAIASLQEEYINNDATEDVQTLMASMPRTVYNTDENTTSVVFNVDENTEKAVLKYEETNDISNIRAESTKLSSAELDEVDEYNNLISIFRDNINSSDDISYTVCSDYEQGEEESTAPGWSFLF